MRPFLDVREMAVGPRVPEILKLADDDVLDGCDRDRLASQGEPKYTVQRPSMQRDLTSEVDVGPECRLVVDDVEVPTLGPQDLRCERFPGGEVEITGVERGDEIPPPRTADRRPRPVISPYATKAPLDGLSVSANACQMDRCAKRLSSCGTSVDRVIIIHSRRRCP